MTLLHADNFSIYGTNTAFMLNGIYARVDGALVNDPDGISGGHVLNLATGSGNTRTPFRYVFQNGAVTKSGVAYRQWLSELPGAYFKDILQFTDTNNDNILLWTFGPTGDLRVQPQGGANSTTPVPVITANGWYHIEVSLTQHGGIGTGTVDFEVRIEGTPVLTGTAQACTNVNNPANLTGNRDAISNGSVPYMKDLVIWDGTGSFNNDFMGSVLVTTLVPTADVDLSGWAPSTGTAGYPILDNMPPLDTAYISGADSPLPGPYLASLSHLPDETTSVRGLISYVRAAKSDGGDGYLQNGLVSHPSTTPTNILGANRPITVAQTYWRDVFEVDPVTSAPWLPGDVNSAQLSINRTA